MLSLTYRNASSEPSPIVVLPRWVIEMYIGVSNLPTTVYSRCLSGNSSASVGSVSVSLLPISTPAFSLLEFRMHSSSDSGIRPSVMSMEFMPLDSFSEYTRVLLS